ncbi:MAG TPA: hypothetical protein VF299_05895 [Mycobacterium sp.]
MASAPPKTAKFGPLLVVLDITGLSAGCGHAGQTKPAAQRPPPADTPKAAPAIAYDLSQHSTRSESCQTC